ncbi:hypothetical protein CVT26_003625, partial [Gymnopilus dilepis]
MTSPRSPGNSSTSSNLPAKKGVFSSSSSRRPSTSTSAGTPTSSALQLPQGIGYSPGSATTYYTTPSSPAGSGIPALRTLRSLLPFGPGSSSSNKNASQTSSAHSSPQTNTPVASTSTSRSPFSPFGSVRKSMTMSRGSDRERERKTSLSNDAFASAHVIAIERQSEDTPIRRSASLSRIEHSTGVNVNLDLEKPLPREPGASSPLGRESSSGSGSGTTLSSAFTLRTPSPGPPLSAELSTIIEADSSGVSVSASALASGAKHFSDHGAAQGVLPAPTPVSATGPTRSQSRSRSPSPLIPSRRPSPSLTPRDFLHPLRTQSQTHTSPT